MATVQARIRGVDGRESLLPVVVPDLPAVRAFADSLHSASLEWEGEAFGWHAEYHPRNPEPPLSSNLAFTPAEFCIGESGVWFFSLMWESGCGQSPVEFLDDSGIVRS